jgi:hypothetical protein
MTMLLVTLPCFYISLSLCDTMEPKSLLGGYFSPLLLGAIGDEREMSKVDSIFRMTAGFK